MAVHRNNSNRDRHEDVDRADLIAEAGEVFTPPQAVSLVLDQASVSALVTDPAASVLEPAAGDGNFVVEIIRRRMHALATSGADRDQVLASLNLVYAVEIQEDNVQTMRRRVQDVLHGALGEDEIHAYIQSRLLAGNFLTGRACDLTCEDTCTRHAVLELPERFDLIVGNPPFNPKRLYQLFVEASMRSAGRVAFVLPTAWKLPDAHAAFRRRVLPHAETVIDLPWATFNIKMRTCILIINTRMQFDHVIYDGEPVRPQGEAVRLANAILSKAYQAWPDTLIRHARSKRTSHGAFIGWKSNLGRDTERVNALQSIADDETSELLPHNTFTFWFSSQRARDDYIAYSSTKLAAYLQTLTDSDTVSRILPLPPLGTDLDCSDDAALYDALELSKSERELIESKELFISAKAHDMYQRLGINVRADAVIGAKRAACPECGSSSFHRKGCSRSTEREKTLRDVKG